VEGREQGATRLLWKLAVAAGIIASGAMFVTKTRPLQATPTKRPISSGSAASASGERFHGARPQLLHRLGQLAGGLDQVLGDLRTRRAIPVLPAPCCADPQQELVWSQRTRAAVFTSVSPSPPPVPGSAASPKTRPRAASRHEQFSSVPRSDTAFRQEFYGAAAYSLPAQCPQPRVSTASRWPSASACRQLLRPKRAFPCRIPVEAHSERFGLLAALLRQGSIPDDSAFCHSGTGYATAFRISSAPQDSLLEDRPDKTADGQIAGRTGRKKF
jgi:hypothetical protein